MKGCQILNHVTAFFETKHTGGMANHAFDAGRKTVLIQTQLLIPGKISPAISIGVVSSLQGDIA
jgi:hypothetical protein